MGRSQLNIKLSESELEQLKKAKESSGRSYKDILLQGAGVEDRPSNPGSPGGEKLGIQRDNKGKSKRKLRIEGETKAGENPGLDAEEVDANPWRR